MLYQKPKYEFWDLEDEGIIVTSLNSGGNNNEEGDGDFDGGGLDWGF